MSLIKSPKDIENLRIAGKVHSEVLKQASKMAVPGATLLEIDSFIESASRAKKCTPSFLGFDGFPNSSCLSVNQQIVHGIPSKRVLEEGDILGIDIGLWYNGVCVDGASTVAVGVISQEAADLLSQTKLALKAGIKAAVAYRRVGSISSAIQQVAESFGLGIVRALTGHGVGHKVHEDPEVPNVGRISDGIILRPGMVLAIEPMLTTGEGDILTEIDGWGIVTADGSLSAQFEHTVLITAKGPEIITL